MADRPATWTADRADRVVAGWFVHDQLPLLSEDAPATGWLAVDMVDADVNGVLLSLSTGVAQYWPRDRVIYMGWA